MAIDLQNPQNIATGWGAAPKFDAPAIGSTLSAILENRRVQQALQQKQIADAVKAIQEQRQQDAYASALRDTGLSEGQDLSGVSSADQTRIAQLLQARTPDTQRDALIQAQIAHLNRLPGGGGRGGGGGGGSAEPETRWDAQGREWRPGPGGRWIPVKPLKPDPGPKLSPTEKGWAAPEIPGVSVDTNAPDDPGRFLPPDTSPMPGPPSVPPLLRRPPSGVPQDAPAETGDPLPTSKVQPSGADKNLAPGYGVPPVGTIRGGYRFNGGDPKDKANWEPIF
jgi:hypothetical protein